MASTTGEPFTLTFVTFDVDGTADCSVGHWIEINDGFTTRRYCGTSLGSSPGNVTGTTIIVKLYTSDSSTASGFFAVVTGDVMVTTDVTGESGVGK